MSKKLTSLLVIFLITFHCTLFGAETIRILTIGNSFSEDAVENFLYDLGKADDVTFIIGNMYIGGCSLELHWTNASGDLAAYSYRKINSSGVKTTTENVTIKQAVEDEDWDYISFQQVSQNSGQYDTYFPYLTNLKGYVADLATNPNLKFVLHATWAYAQVNSHGGFANYNNDQNTMYNAIVEATSSAATTAGINIIIPSGTAIQNARTSFLGDNLCRDGYHLNLQVGRYTAACTWYEKLSGNVVDGNTYSPASLSLAYTQVAQKAAHNAVLTPNSVTDLGNTVLDPNTFITTAPINIDFGATTTLSASPWNNMTSFSLGGSVLGLQDMNGDLTPIGIEVTEAFGGVNPNGPDTDITLNEWAIPRNASKDSFYGSGGKTSSFSLSNLNKDLTYSFTVFTSRTSAIDNRETFVQAEGINTKIASANSSVNTTELITINGVKPKADGTIIIKVGAGNSNNNTSKFFYINTLQITMEEIDEPLPEPDTFLLTAPVNINFGRNTTALAKYWNNLNSTLSGTSIAQLRGEDGQQTPFNISIVNRFGDFNPDGSPVDLEIDGWLIPKEVTSDSFFGNAGASFQGLSIVSGSFLLSNLNPNQAYDLSMLASRLYVADNRETYINVEGKTTGRAVVNSSGNTTKLATIDQIQPKADGTITLTVGAGDNNNNSYKFFYINALRIKQNLDFGTSINSESGDERGVDLESNYVAETLTLLGLDENAQYEYAIYQVDGKIVKRGRLADANIGVFDLPSSYYILALNNSVSKQSYRMPFLKINY